MNVLLIEDEEVATRNLLRTLQQLRPHWQVQACIQSVAKAVEWLRANPLPELILMDIHLADGAAFDIFDHVSLPVPIIFTTAYDEYLLKAFEVNSIDYLLKPIAPEKLEKSLQKFEDQKQYFSQSVFQSLQQYLQPSSSQTVHKDRFLVKKGSKLFSVTSDQIAYFYRKEVVILVTQEGQGYPINYVLDDLERLLNPTLFFRLNRQYITHIQSIATIHAYFKGKLKLDLLPTPTTDIIVSQEKASLLKKWLGG